VTIVNHKGEIISTQTTAVKIDPFWQTTIPIAVKLPEKSGGYMIISELDDVSSETAKQVSRRYFLVGDAERALFPDYKYELPPEWPK
jgi:hypothetical protein